MIVGDLAGEVEGGGVVIGTVALVPGDVGVFIVVGDEQAALNVIPKTKIKTSNPFAGI